MGLPALWLCAEPVLSGIEAGSVPAGTKASPIGEAFVPIRVARGYWTISWKVAVCETLPDAAVTVTVEVDD